MNFRFLRLHASFAWRVDARNQIWCESDEPFWSYYVFKPISGFVGRHLGFWKVTFLTPPVLLGGVETKLHVKFGENRTNGSKVIKVFVKFKMAAGGHLVFQISWFPVTRSLRMWSWCCMSNLVKIGLMVQKLSTFFFPIGNALRVPQNWGFWGF